MVRIAVHNAFAYQPVAETGLSKRICRASLRLGWDAIETGSSAEINAYDPDFVIALHFLTPKLTKHPTYGCMWNPPVFFETKDAYIRNVLSYDGYLSSSTCLTTWINDALWSTHKRYFIAPFYTSCHFVTYRPPQLTNLKVLYAGTNWDGPRFKDFFQELDTKPFTEIYGPAKVWSYLRNSYCGLLPFDGTSILGELNRAGVGLCMHKLEHCQAATPSLRIFEISASGAIGICEEHPFIREAFGDSVLYLDSNLDPRTKAEQVGEYVNWIANNPQTALEMSRAAYDIFVKNYAFENLLSNILPHHQKLLSEKALVPESRKHGGDARVQLVVRSGNRPTEKLERALDSVARQTYRRVAVILVTHGPLVDPGRIARKYKDTLPIEIVEGSPQGCRSTHMWEGLRKVTAEYFGILDDDDIIHPNHIAVLVDLLDRFQKYGFAYSGAIRVWEREDGGPSHHPEPAELLFSQRFDQNRLVALDNYITSNSFIARRSFIEDLPQDPRVPVWEDLLLFLFLSTRTEFVFSHDVTCEFFLREDHEDNTVVGDRRLWDETFPRLQRIFGCQSFVASQDVRQPQSHLIAAVKRLESVAAKMGGS